MGPLESACDSLSPGGAKKSRRDLRGINRENGARVNLECRADKDHRSVSECWLEKAHRTAEVDYSDKIER
jgi:hypothetical protein